MMSNALTAGMKQILQRTVTAFLNSNYTDPDSRSRCSSSPRQTSSQRHPATSRCLCATSPICEGH